MDTGWWQDGMARDESSNQHKDEDRLVCVPPTALLQQAGGKQELLISCTSLVEIIQEAKPVSQSFPEMDVTRSRLYHGHAGLGVRPEYQPWIIMGPRSSGDIQPTCLVLPVWNMLRTQNTLRICTTASVPDRQLELLPEGDLWVEKYPL